MLTDLDTRRARALAELEEQARNLEVAARQLATLAEALRPYQGLIRAAREVIEEAKEAAIADSYPGLADAIYALGHHAIEAEAAPGLPLTAAQRAQMAASSAECAAVLGLGAAVVARLRRGEHWIG